MFSAQAQFACGFNAIVARQAGGCANVRMVECGLPRREGRMARFAISAGCNVGRRILGGQNTCADGNRAVVAGETGTTDNAMIEGRCFPRYWRVARCTVSAAVEGQVVVGQTRGRHAIVAAVATRRANVCMVEQR
mgnify:CR=1 FL=1